MIKKLFVVMLALTFLLATAAVALAGTGRWLNDSRNYISFAYAPTTGKHNGTYGTATNKCSNCHAVHNAGTDYAGANAYKLLRSPSGGVLGACNFCHTTGAAGVPQPYGGSGTTRAEHVLGPKTTLPDSTLVLTVALGGSDLTCLSCHNAAPHNAGGVASSKLFKDVGSGTGNQDQRTTPVCKRCHNANDVNEFDQRSHILTVSNATGNLRAAQMSTQAYTGRRVFTSASSQYCMNCHANTGGDATSMIFPHRSQAARFLTTAAGDLNQAGTGGTLDAVCVGCHQWNSGGSGVGINF